MEKGQIKSKAFLPKFAKELDKSLDKVDPSKTVGFQITQMSNAWEEFKLNFFSGGFDTGVKSLLKAVTIFLRESIPMTKVLGSLFKGMMITLSSIIRLLNIGLRELGKLFGLSHEGLNQMKLDWIAVGGAILSAVAALKTLKLITGALGIGKLGKGIAGAVAGSKAKASKPTSAFGSARESMKSMRGDGAAKAAKMLGGLWLPSLIAMLGVNAVTTPQSEASKEMAKRAMQDSPFSSRYLGTRANNSPTQVEVKVSTDDSKVSEIIQTEIKVNGEAVTQSLLNNSTL